MSAERLRCVSPVDGSVYVERPYAGPAEVEEALVRARAAQRAWRDTPVEARQASIGRAVDAFVAQRGAIAEEVTRQMGRPIAQSPGEVGGFEERARHMIGIAPRALANVAVDEVPGFTRFIRRVPLGVVFVVAPWNYPYLTAVNSIVPALLAGNAVLLKHSSQTPLCAERLTAAFAAAGLPEGLFQHLHLSHADTTRLASHEGVDYVAFTGSVAGGEAVQRAISSHFIAAGLELGGKDPAYVRGDADLEHAIETVVDGAFFNAGQSCCGIERVYVHASRYDDFVAGARALVRAYRLGDPLDPETTLGPMVRGAAADFVRDQVAEAVAGGATALIEPGDFAPDERGSPYLAPQILIGLDHSARIMTEETFGPAVGIMPVRDDEEAIALMNDSVYGLTAALFSRDVERAAWIGDRLETGTVFLNRCDYLDPALAWTGVKQSGRGCSLSALGYESLTRPKSFHLRHPSAQP